MDSNTLLTSLLSGGTAGAVVSAIWGHISKLLLQRREEKSKERLASIEAELKANFAKIEADLKLSQNLLQARIDRSVFVTKAHFDTEFEAIKQVFSYLSGVHLAMNGLRPMMTVEPTDESFDDRMARLLPRLASAQDAYNKLLLESEAKLPFYPTELYKAVEDCLRIASIEINSIRTGGHMSFTVEWYLEGSRNSERFSTAYHKAADLIRERISKLAILPSQ
jgi:hypothetical protein